MEFFDFIIIYLACGSPFGVYYFLHFRHKSENHIFYLKLFLHFIFWIPFCLKLLNQTFFFRKLFDSAFEQRVVSDATREIKIIEIQKSFENEIIRNKIQIQLFEFRETFNRFVGLSREIHHSSTSITEPENDFFQIFQISNTKIPAICLHRRNLRRIYHHQNLARKDFLALFEKFLETDQSRQVFLEIAFQLIDLLDDPELKTEIDNLLHTNLKIEINQSVKTGKNESWNTGKLTSPSPQSVSAKMSVFKTTANFSAKD